MDALDRLTPKKSDTEQKNGDAEHGVVEIEAEGPEAEKELASLQVSDQRREDIRRIQAKALMRRARAKSEQGGWGNLQGAEEGTHPSNNLSEGLLISGFRLQRTRTNAQLTAARQEDRAQRLVFAPFENQRSQGARDGRNDGEAEGGTCSTSTTLTIPTDMRQLGNGILKPFGLSTDNFNMVKDEATGGYSMNFNQGR